MVYNIEKETVFWTLSIVQDKMLKYNIKITTFGKMARLRSVVISIVYFNILSWTMDKVQKTVGSQEV
jgi:hypothetical protein